MNANGARCSARVVSTVLAEAQLTNEGLARELDCSVLSVIRWKRRGELNLDALLLLLQFACSRKLPKASAELLEQFQTICGPTVKVSARCGDVWIRGRVRQ